MHHPVEDDGMEMAAGGAAGGFVVMEPASQTWDSAGARLAFVRAEGAQKFTCSCHCAMLSGMRWLKSSSVNCLGAVYMTPTRPIALAIFFIEQ